MRRGFYSTKTLVLEYFNKMSVGIQPLKQATVLLVAYTLSEGGPLIKN